jgi:hypothetical protein
VHMNTISAINCESNVGLPSTDFRQCRHSRRYAQRSRRLHGMTIRGRALPCLSYASLAGEVYTAYGFIYDEITNHARIDAAKLV